MKIIKIYKLFNSHWSKEISYVYILGREHYTNLPLSVLGNKNRTPQSNRRESWENAVTQAENAFLLERRERKLTCMYNYNSDQGTITKKKKQPNKVKQNSSSSKKMEKIEKKVCILYKNFSWYFFPVKCYQ